MKTGSSFEYHVKQDTPRLIIEYQRSEAGEDRFQWGIVGSIPVLAIIGYIVQVQHDIASEWAEPRNECPKQALVVALVGGEFMWWVGKEIPRDALVGMLEVVKAAIVGGRLGQAAASQRVLWPDGRPFGGR